MIEITTTQVIGLVMAGGAGFGVLVKGGYLRIGKNNNSEKAVTKEADVFDQGACDRKHNDFDKTIAAWDKMGQTMVLTQQDHKNNLKQHTKELDEGKERMDDLQGNLKEVDIGVALLLDRSGGDPRKKKV